MQRSLDDNDDDDERVRRDDKPRAKRARTTTDQQNARAAEGAAMWAQQRFQARFGDESRAETWSYRKVGTTLRKIKQRGSSIRTKYEWPSTASQTSTRSTFHQLAQSEPV
jgi:hypothetical protein